MSDPNFGEAAARREGAVAGSAEAMTKADLHRDAPSSSLLSATMRTLMGLDPLRLAGAILFIAGWQAADPSLFAHLLYTAENAAITVLLGSAIGATPGLLSARISFVWATINPIMMTAGTVPILIAAPFLLIWFGVGRASAVSLVRWLTEWPGPCRPTDLCERDDRVILVTDQVPSVYAFAPNEARIGRGRPSLNGAHGIAPGLAGEIYVAEIDPSFVTKLTPC
jgi:hypothetical protein